MGYSGVYSIYTRCFYEFASSLTFCVLLGSLLANKLLPKTKASDLTFGWLAFSVGLVVYATTQYYGHISAMFNPAVSLPAAILGHIDWIDLPYFFVAQMIGAFVGNVLVWIFYLPLFQTTPEPAPTEDNERLLRTRDDIGPDALNFVSYSTRQEAAVPAAGVGIGEFGRMLGATRSVPPSEDVEHMRVFSVSTQGAGGTGPLVRRTVSVSYADSRLQVIDGDTSLRRRVPASPPEANENAEPLNQRVINVESTSNNHRKSAANSFEMSKAVETSSANALAVQLTNDSAKEMDTNSTNRTNEPSRPQKACNDEVLKDSKGADQVELDPKMVASQIADQQMKLSIFCARPARYLPISNLIAEIFATFFLVTGVFSILYRSEFLYDEYNDLYMHGSVSFLVGIHIAVMVLCFGGMGVSMNPITDLAGRLAHWALPIDGKGVSEWYYAWIPFFGPLIGGALAGFAFLGMKELQGEKDRALA